MFWPRLTAEVVDVVPSFFGLLSWQGRDNPARPVILLDLLWWQPMLTKVKKSWYFHLLDSLNSILNVTSKSHHGLHHLLLSFTSHDPNLRVAKYQEGKRDFKPRSIIRGDLEHHLNSECSISHRKTHFFIINQFSSTWIGNDKEMIGDNVCGKPKQDKSQYVSNLHNMSAHQVKRIYAYLLVLSTRANRGFLYRKGQK